MERRFAPLAALLVGLSLTGAAVAAPLADGGLGRSLRSRGPCPRSWSRRCRPAALRLPTSSPRSPMSGRCRSISAVSSSCMSPRRAAPLLARPRGSRPASLARASTCSSRMSPASTPGLLMRRTAAGLPRPVARSSSRHRRRTGRRGRVGRCDECVRRGVRRARARRRTRASSGSRRASKATRSTRTRTPSDWFIQASAESAVACRAAGACTGRNAISKPRCGAHWHAGSIGYAGCLRIRRSPPPNLPTTPIPTNLPTDSPSPSIEPTAHAVPIRRSRPIEPTALPTPAPTPSPSATPEPTVPIAQARAQANGTSALITGVLTTPLGALETGRKAFIQDETGGIALYLDAAVIGGLPAGTRVTVSGTLDDRFAERTFRIAVATIAFGDVESTPLALLVQTGMIGEPVEGARVLVQGHTVGSPTDLSDGLGLMVDDGSGEVRVIVGTRCPRRACRSERNACRRDGPSRAARQQRHRPRRVPGPCDGGRRLRDHRPAEPVAGGDPRATRRRVSTPTRHAVTASTVTPHPDRDADAVTDATPANRDTRSHAATHAEHRRGTWCTGRHRRHRDRRRDRRGREARPAPAHRDRGWDRRHRRSVARWRATAGPRDDGPRQGSSRRSIWAAGDPAGQLRVQGHRPGEPSDVAAADGERARRGDRRPPRDASQERSSPRPRRAPAATSRSTSPMRRACRSASWQTASSGVVATDLVKGRSYRLTGIVGQRASRKGALDGYRLYVRDRADVVALSTAPGGPGRERRPDLRDAGLDRARTRGWIVGDRRCRGHGRRQPARHERAADRGPGRDRPPSRCTCPQAGRHRAVGAHLRITGKTGHAWGAPRIVATSVEAIGGGRASLPRP